MSRGGWIGVDLDGTLAQYDGWKGELVIGAPIPAMVERIRTWVTEGREVRIFTARVCEPDVPDNRARASVHQIRDAVQAWLVEHVGFALPVTNVKDFGMVELWDDRAIRCVPNTGEPCCSDGRVVYCIAGEEIIGTTVEQVLAQCLESEFAEDGEELEVEEWRHVRTHKATARREPAGPA